MNPDEYNALVKQLQDKIDQKGTLIRFRVLQYAERLSRYPVLFRNVPPETLAIEWFTKIQDKTLVGSTLFTINFILDIGIDGSVEYIIGNALTEINHAITHPDEIKEAQFVI